MNVPFRLLSIRKLLFISCITLLWQSEEVTKTTESVYDVTNAFLVFLNMFLFQICQQDIHATYQLYLHSHHRINSDHSTYTDVKKFNENLTSDLTEKK